MSFGVRAYSFLGTALTAVVAWCALGTPDAMGCPYSIRDSVFLRNDSASAFQLCFVVRTGTPDRDKLTEWVEPASGAWLGDTNVVAGVVDIDRPSTHVSGELLRAKYGSRQDLPVAVLVSPEGETLGLVPPKSGKPSLDWVMDTMADVVESPARDQLRKHLVKAWCVVIMVEGADPDRNRRAKEAIEAAGKRITGTTTELDKVVTAGPHLIVVSPEDPQERVVLWTLGLLPGADAKPVVRAVMIVGRGEVRGPTLIGEKLTARSMFECFEMLGRSCSCTTAEVWFSGPAVPLAWGAAMDEAIEDELGFDLDDPAVISSIQGATGMGPASSGLGVGGIGYREVYFDAGTGAATTTVADETSVAGVGMLVITLVILRRSRSPGRYAPAESSSRL